MILIISNDFEVTTTEVAKWLHFYNTKFIILTETNVIVDLKYILSEIGIVNIELTTSRNQVIDINKIKAVWYRRGKFHYKKDNFNGLGEYFNSKIMQEWEVVNEFLLNKTLNCSIGNYFTKKLNKLLVLQKAASFGLKVPLTLITNKKKDVIQLFNCKRVINKSIDDIFCTEINGNIFSNKTIEIKIDELSDEFYPSLFQELIEKI